jgi:hypothetical protein
MIRVLLGSESSLSSYCDNWIRSSGSEKILLLARNLFFTRSWEGTRQLADQLRQRLPAGHMDEVLAKYIPAASLVLYDLEPALNSREHSLQDGLAAHLPSHMTHNWLVQYPLFKEWGALLGRLMERQGFTIIIPDLGVLTWEDAAVLKAIYRSPSSVVPDLILGIDPNAENRPDKNGLLWNMPVPKQMKLAWGLLNLPESDSKTLKDEPISEAALSPTALPNDLETSAFVNLRDSAGSPTAETCQSVMKAIRSAFRNFGFTTANRLGLALLEKNPELTLTERAEVHAIVGLSAHNRQFNSAGNFLLADFLEQQFRMALASEPAPLARAALCYRLAVTLGRRKGQLEESRFFVEEAVTAAADVSVPPLLRAYQEAWAYNIKAFVSMRAKKMEAALAEAETAFSRLDDALSRTSERILENGGLDSMWRLDAKSSHAVIAHNRANLGRMLQRGQGDAKAWLTRANSQISDLPATDRFEALSWIEIFIEGLQLDLALEKALQGIASARFENSADLEYRYSVKIADLSYRLGDFPSAREYFDVARELRRRGWLASSDAIDTLSALACAHAGLLDSSIERLEALLQPANETQPQILAWLAWVEAHRGNLKAVRERADAAWDLAREIGKRDILLRVATVTGSAFQRVGWNEKAVDHYHQALSLGAFGENLPPAVDILQSGIGILECNGVDADLALRLIGIIRQALKYPEGWQALKRLLDVLSCTAERIPDLLGSPELKSNLELLITSSRQRSDCTEPLDRFLCSYTISAPS